MKKAEKSIFVQNLVEELKGASSVVLVDYSGLNVKAQQDLKKKLRAVNAKMLVVKNTLFKLAGKTANVPKEAMTDTVLTGPVALVVTEEDPIAPLQVLGKFAQEHEIPQLKVGVIEGSFQDKETLVRLSQLPAREVLVGQVVGSIGAPLYGIVGVLQGNMQKLLSVLDQARTAGR
ncbi:50S ribosomal protein L10 [Patescibacteria group bacterium]|nr:50S ribosomal protein L10 [Patescibacteria group bacterium]